jgi:hypothetical protein
MSSNPSVNRTPDPTGLAVKPHLSSGHWQILPRSTPRGNRSRSDSTLHGNVPLRAHRAGKPAIRIRRLGTTFVKDNTAPPSSDCSTVLRLTKLARGHAVFETQRAAERASNRLAAWLFPEGSPQRNSSNTRTTLFSRFSNSCSQMRMTCTPSLLRQRITFRSR